MVDEEKAGYLDLYIEEAGGILKVFSESLNKLKTNPSDTQTIEIACRSMHTFASNSGFMGFGKISRLTRNIEYFFDYIKKKNTPLTPEMLTTLTKQYEIVNNWLTNIRQNETEPEIEQYIAELEKLKK